MLGTKPHDDARRKFSKENRQVSDHKALSTDHMLLPPRLVQTFLFSTMLLYTATMT